MSRREFGFGARAAALQGGRDLGRILFACTARVSGAASRRGVNFARYSASRCFSTSARTSASVAVVMIVRMMIGRDRSVRLYNMAAKPLRRNLESILARQRIRRSLRTRIRARSQNRMTWHLNVQEYLESYIRLFLSYIFFGSQMKGAPTPIPPVQYPRRGHPHPPAYGEGRN
jgi:hypothetical protein